LTVADTTFALHSLFFLSFFLLLYFVSLVRRGVHHAFALLALIERFPRKNPRPDEEEGVDMSARLRLIRSRYKAMCASLGVRARLQPAPSSVRAEAEDGPGTREGERALATGTASILDPDDADTEKRGQRRQKKKVWPLTGPLASASATQGLSF